MTTPRLQLVAASCSAIGLFLVARRYLRWKREVREQGNQLPMIVPNPSMLGFVGEAKANFHRLFSYRLEKFVEADTLTMYNVPPIWYPAGAIMSADWRIAKHILKDNVDNYLKSDLLKQMLSELVGNGIFAADHGPHADDGGVSWKTQRKTASKIFTKNKFLGYIHDVVAETNDQLVARIRREGAQGPIDVQNLFYKYTLDAIGQIGFGIRLHTLSKDNVPFAVSFDEMNRIIPKRFMNPGWNTWLGKLVYSNERAMLRHKRVLDQTSDEIIRNRIRDEKVEEKMDILSMFIASEKKQSGTTDTCDPVFLRDVIMSFFLAGRDTTAGLLSFVFLCLARHQHVQDKLREEIGATPVGKDGLPSLEDLKNNMPYLNGVIFETLRLFPPVPQDLKMAVNDDVLPDGTVIRAGMRITFEPFIMGRHPKLWDKPEEFLPERWFNKEVNPFEFPVFQAGPRICIGKDLALFESKSVTFSLIQRFKFSPDPARPVPDPEYRPGITLTAAGGVQVVVEELQ